MKEEVKMEDRYLFFDEPLENNVKDLIKLDKDLAKVAASDIAKESEFELSWENVEKVESLFADRVKLPDAPKITQYFSGSLRYTKNRRLTPYFRFRLENDIGAVLTKQEFFYHEKSLENDINNISKTKDFWTEIYRDYDKEPENVKEALIEGDLDNILKAQFDAFVNELQFVLTGHFIPSSISLNLYYNMTKRNNIKIKGTIKLGMWECDLEHPPLTMKDTVTKVYPHLSYKMRSILVLNLDQAIANTNCHLSTKEQELERIRYINEERERREQERRRKLEEKRRLKWAQLKNHIKLLLLKLCNVYDNKKTKIMVFTDYGNVICMI
jgi:hypothetical protein